tara:strand:- start:2078 stop:3247 length:1170 start_codon:yes stop_codon:yes gene_type:complete
MGYKILDEDGDPLYGQKLKEKIDFYNKLKEDTNITKKLIKDNKDVFITYNTFKITKIAIILLFKGKKVNDAEIGTVRKYITDRANSDQTTNDEFYITKLNQFITNVSKKLSGISLTDCWENIKTYFKTKTCTYCCGLGYILNFTTLHVVCHVIEVPKAKDNFMYNKKKETLKIYKNDLVEYNNYDLNNDVVKKELTTITDIITKTVTSNIPKQVKKNTFEKFKSVYLKSLVYDSESTNETTLKNIQKIVSDLITQIKSLESKPIEKASFKETYNSEAIIKLQGFSVNMGEMKRVNMTEKIKCYTIKYISYNDGTLTCDMEYENDNGPIIQHADADSFDITSIYKEIFNSKLVEFLETCEDLVLTCDVCNKDNKKNECSGAEERYRHLYF